MNILLLGAGGQVGSELRGTLAPLGTIQGCTRADVDLRDAARLAAFLEDARADIVVNAAAYTAVDRAEGEPDIARAVNAEAVARLAAHCRAREIPLVHFSTDYVFDGTLGRPYREEDAPHPLSVYGRTKLEGEDAIRQSGCAHLILRTSWVYGVHGGNFLKTMLRLAAEREELRVVSDQSGVPTSARWLAGVTAAAVGAGLADAPAGGGTFHAVPAGATSWHGYASHIVEAALARGVPLKARRVTAIASAEFPAAAPRPADSRLDGTRLARELGIAQPAWQDLVDGTLATLFAKEGTGA